MNAAEIIQKMEAMEGERSVWETRWQDCADYGMPQNSQIITFKAPGAEHSVDLFDTTAEDSNIQLAAGLYSHMFPAENKAFVLKIDDNRLNEMEAVKNWLDEVTKIIHIILIQSNFRQAFFEFLKSLGCFGTACMYIEKGKKNPANFQCIHISGVYIDINSEGNVDTVFVQFEYTARQAVQEFGEKKLAGCTDILDAYKDKKSSKRFRFIHAVYPRADRDDTKEDPINMPIVSQWVWRNDKEGKEIILSGYNEMPYMVDRFDRDVREKYGRSPMMKKLPDIKMINRMAKTRIKGWEKKTDPPIVVPDDGSIWPLATKPGGVLYKRAGSDDPFWFEFKGDMREMEEAIKSVQTDIRAGFYLDKFDVLIDRKNMTATEVMARIDQQMRFLTPIIGRLQSEFFNPMILRLMGVLGRAGVLPEVPAEIKDVDFSIEYLGKLALAIKTLETEGLAKTLEDWAPLAEVDASYLDNLDVDKAFRDSARNNGLPASWLKDEETIETERAERQQAAQAAALAEQLPNIAKAAKAAGTKPEDGSITKGMLDAA